MQNLVFKNILIAVLVILAAFALLIYLLKLLAQWYVVNFEINRRKDQYVNKQERKGLKPFKFETTAGAVTFYALNLKNAEKKFKKSGLTLKTETDAK